MNQQDCRGAIVKTCKEAVADEDRVMNAHISGQSKLLPIGSRITHFDGGPYTHGKGTIVDYNTTQPNSYAMDRLGDAVDIASKIGAIASLARNYYGGDRCPYIVQWDNGYRDVYEHESVNLLRE